MGWRTRWTTTRRAVMFQSAASRDVSKLLKQGHSATSRGNSVEGFGNAGQSQEGVEADRPVSSDPPLPPPPPRIPARNSLSLSDPLESTAPHFSITRSVSGNTRHSPASGSRTELLRSDEYAWNASLL